MRLLLFLIFLGDVCYLLFRSPLHPAPSYTYLLILLFIFACLVTSVCLVFFRRYLYCGFCLLAFIIGALCAAHAWDVREKGRILEVPDWQWHTIRGVVSDLPTETPYGWTWPAQISELCDEESGCRVWQHQLRINDYTRRPPPKAGEQWQWSVRVKPSHGAADPGLLLREQFDWYNGIDGYATVNRKIVATRLQESRGYQLEKVRADIAKRILMIIPDSPNVGLILGLVLGIRDHITNTQWQLVRATGTSHLLAISGLHIALVASIAFYCGHWLWRCSAAACCLIAAPRIAWFVAWICAVIYSALAGFAIPTVRSMIMISVYMITQIGYRALPKGYGLLLALAAVILWDPLAPLSLSFILSFGAVAVLTIAVVPESIRTSGWKKLLHTQWVATIGLMPVTIWLFQQFSLVGIIANLVAIPWVGWLSVPACFAALILLFLPKCAYWVFQFADYSLACLFWFLAKLSESPYAVWHTVLPNTWVLVISFVCVILFITQSSKQWLLLALTGLIGAFLFIHPHPKQGEMWLTVLDVGQGLSVIVQTHQHILLFDAGPKFPGGIDMGEKIVMPALRYYGWRRLDILVVSHGDNDHFGGAKSIISHFPKLRILTSVPQKFLPLSAEYCHAGQHWQWDGVEFSMLHPDQSHSFSGNNASCVLKIKNQFQQILLPGDIEAPGEGWIVDHDQQQQLKSTILIAAHHGSKTSSTEEWLHAVQPNWVVFSTGFLNRFHFPNTIILERYQNLGIKILDTADSGAIEFRCGKELKIKRQRDQRCLFNLC